MQNPSKIFDSRDSNPRLLAHQARCSHIPTELWVDVIAGPKFLDDLPVLAGGGGTRRRGCESRWIENFGGILH